MKKLTVILFLLSAVVSARAQVNIWNPFRSTAPKTDITSEQVEKALIERLKAQDRKILAAGEMRAYRFDPKTVLNVTIKHESFYAYNYDRSLQYCHAILLDREGTFIFNATCRKAMQFAHKKVSFVIDFSPLLPGRFVTVTNYPTKGFLYKRNYMLGSIDLPATLQQELPPFNAPVLVQKPKSLFAEKDETIVRRPLKQLFNKKISEERRERLFDRLPAYFSASVPGFKRP